MNNIISIKWKDTDDKTYQDVKYRNVLITRYNLGWIFDNNDDVYHCLDCAKNQIDITMGLPSRKPNQKRIAHGIRVIGKKVDA